MMVGVHQSRRDHAALRADHLTGGLQVRPDFRDDALIDPDIDVSQLPPVVIHRQEVACFLYNNLLHGKTL